MGHRDILFICIFESINSDMACVNPGVGILERFKHSTHLTLCVNVCADMYIDVYIYTVCVCIYSLYTYHCAKMRMWIQMVSLISRSLFILKQFYKHFFFSSFAMGFVQQLCVIFGFIWRV